MRQNTKDFLFSALAGFTKGVIAVAGLAVLDFGAVAVTGVSSGAISAGIAAAAFTPTLALMLGCACLLAGPLSPRRADYERKGFTELLAGAATVVAGINLLLGLFFKPSDPSVQNHTHNKAPVEDTRGVSFLNHENTFNAAAKNSKKTLVLTAKDFSSTPAAAQKATAA